MIRSVAKIRKGVTEDMWPKFNGQKLYMIPVDVDEELPGPLLRWRPIINEMLSGVDVVRNFYVMVEQSIVEAGKFHRRPGLHVDGYWDEAKDSHSPSPPGHRSGGASWAEYDFSRREGIMICSNAGSTFAIDGKFEGTLGEGGSADGLVSTKVNRILATLPNDILVGNVSMIHGSLPAKQTMERSIIRLNIPGWSPS